METFQDFEEIEAWQMARELMNEIYKASLGGDFAEDAPLRDRIRRTAAAIMAKIAEGHERGRRREFLQFLAVAKGAIGEVRSHLYVATDQGYLNQEDLERISKMAKKTGREIGTLMNFLRSTEMETPQRRFTDSARKNTPRS